LATQFAVDLVFKSQTQQLDQVVNKIAKFERDLAKLKGADPFQGVEDSANGAGQAVDRLKGKAGGAAGALRSLAGAFAGLAIGNKLRGSFLDAANLDATNTRAKNLVQSYGQLAGIQDVAAKAATKFQISNNQSLSDLVDLGNRLGSQGTSLKDLQNIYEGFNTLLVKNKIETSQAAAAQLQLNQALGSGRLAGEEFNAISESAPQLLDEVAKILKRNRGELKQLAADGEISSQVLIQALTNIRDQGAADLESALQGPAGELKRFEKAMSDFSVTVGQELLPAITPLLQEATKLLQLFGQLPGPVKTTAVAFAALGAAALVVAPAISAVVQALMALKGLGIASALIAAGPWVAAAAGVAALGKALYDTNQTFRNFVNNVGGVLASDFRGAVDGMATDASNSANAIQIAYADAKAKLKPIADGIREFFKSAFKGVSEAATASAATSTSAFSSFFSSLVSQGSAAFAGLSSIVSNWWASLPAPIRNLFGGGAIGDLVGAANYAKGVGSRTQAASTQQSGMHGRYASGSAQTAFTDKPKAAPAPAYAGGGGAAAKGGGGGAGAAERAQKEAAERTRALADLKGQVALKEQLMLMDRQIFTELQKKNFASAAALEMDKILLERQEKIESIKRSDADAATKELQIKQATLEADRALVEASQERQKAQADFQQSFDDTIKNIERQIALEGAGSEELRRQLEIQHQIEDINKGELKLTQDQIQALKDKNLELDKTKEKAAAIKQKQAELQNLYDGIGSQIANGVGGAIDAVAGNVENLGETLQGLAADILKAVGKMLIFYALAQAFGALGGSDGVGLFSMLAKGFGGGRASGGPVEPNTTYLVGENGPELLQMGSSGGRVYNNEQTTAAMSRYSPAGGGRAAAGSESGGGGEAAGGGGGTFTLETVVINRQEYATIEQVREMGQAAAKQGAEGGHSRVMGDFRNKRSVRSRLGMR
jgi:tape measure domain-containing protein